MRTHTDNPTSEKTDSGSETQAPTQTSIVISLPIEQIEPHPENKRIYQTASSEDDTRLRNSMKEDGQREPIQVVKKEEAYQIISGHRRHQVAKELGWEFIKAIIAEELDTSEEVSHLVSSNIYRTRTKGTVAREIAALFRAAGEQRGGNHKTKKAGMTLQDIGEKHGISKRHVSTLRDLGEAPRPVQDAVDEGIITLSEGASYTKIGEDAQIQVFGRLNRLSELRNSEGKIDKKVHKQTIDKIKGLLSPKTSLPKAKEAPKADKEESKETKAPEAEATEAKNEEKEEAPKTDKEEQEVSEAIRKAETSEDASEGSIESTNPHPEATTAEDQTCSDFNFEGPDSPKSSDNKDTDQEEDLENSSENEDEDEVVTSSKESEVAKDDECSVTTQAVLVRFELSEQDFEGLVGCFWDLSEIDLAKAVWTVEELTPILALKRACEIADIEYGDEGALKTLNALVEGLEEGESGVKFVLGWSLKNLEIQVAESFFGDR